MKYGDEEYMGLLYKEAFLENDGSEDFDKDWFDKHGFDGHHLVYVEPLKVGSDVVAAGIMKSEKENTAIDVTLLCASAFAVGIEAGVRLGKARWET